MVLKLSIMHARNVHDSRKPLGKTVWQSPLTVSAACCAGTRTPWRAATPLVWHHPMGRRRVARRHDKLQRGSGTCGQRDGGRGRLTACNPRSAPAAGCRHQTAQISRA